MGEFIASYGPWGFVMFPGVWFVVHRIAQPGEQISVFGISYTKKVADSEAPQPRRRVPMMTATAAVVLLVAAVGVSQLQLVSFSDPVAVRSQDDCVQLGDECLQISPIASRRTDQTSMWIGGIGLVVAIASFLLVRRPKASGS